MATKKLTLMQEKYILRAQHSSLGYVEPEGKQQTQLCDKLVELGEFVRVEGLDGPGYTTPAMVEKHKFKVIQS